MKFRRTKRYVIDSKGGEVISIIGPYMLLWLAHIAR
jgi:hypothetical protein